MKPKLIGFDLDGTIWTPDMYMLYGGAPFTVAGDGTKQLKDSRGDTVELLGISGTILHDLNYHEAWEGVRVAWVSKCDEPEWADECLRKFRSTGVDPKPLEKLAHTSHIYKGNKKDHFRRIQKEFPQLQFEDMVFYDNQMDNIRAVEGLGVACYYCPQGMTEKIWLDSLEHYAQRMSKK